MPASLVTDWKRIAQSGPTVDGRNIEPQWLLDMAETYDPDVYTAKLWLDHMRYASYGSVRALKAEKDGDIVRLFARISPSRSLLQMNQVWEEYLHFSIEPTENFAETGKCYLTGLGMTDMPASLGTEEMRFATVPGRTFTARYPGEPVPDLRDMEDDNQMDHFGRKLARWLFRLQEPGNPDNPDKQEEQTPMDEKQFNTLTQTLEATQAAVTELAGKIESFSAVPPAAAPAPAGDSAPAADPAPVDDGKEFTELKSALETLTTQFKTLVDRLEAANPGTQFGDTTGAAGDQDELL